MSAKPTTQQFGKSTREVPASADKAKKWYPADDDSAPKKVSLFGHASQSKQSPWYRCLHSQFGTTWQLGLKGTSRVVWERQDAVGRAWEI